MLILYITYIDFGAAASGSGVRPQKMYQALLDEGHKVKLLSGKQGGFTSHGQRKRAVAEVSAWLDSHTPDICYIESPYYPILWGFDRRLIRKIHRLGIPIGYFYRDFVRRFPGMLPRPRDFLGRLKDSYMSFMQRLTDKTLECADIVYFPTQEAATLFSYRDMRPLPPGGENYLSQCVPEERRCIYVGGIVLHYSGEMLLKAFQLLNAGEDRYPLTLVCRENEWAQIPDELKIGDWLDVRHVSGEALVPLMSAAGAGLLIGKSTYPYNDYTYSIKLFEYLGYGLPVVYVKNVPTDRFARENGIGIGVEDSPESFAEGVRALFADKEHYADCQSNAQKTFTGSNMWVHRVRQVVQELSEKKERSR